MSLRPVLTSLTAALATLAVAVVPLATTSSAASIAAESEEIAAETTGRLIFDVSTLEDHERTRVRVAIARFVDAGLELPALRFEFHEDAAMCSGHDGIIRYGGNVPVISICSDRDYVLPHELAHAWADAHVDRAVEQRYVEHWGLASWNDHADDWADRGTEHAAFAIQQNLTANPPRLTDTWFERIEAFEMLTGRTSPLRP